MLLIKPDNLITSHPPIQTLYPGEWKIPHFVLYLTATKCQLGNPDAALLPERGDLAGKAVV